MTPGDKPKARTGIAGLDDILAGGLTSGNLFLLEGEPGSGKTTIAMQFLLEGRKAGEQTLYITLSETEDELRASAASHDWELDGIHIAELVPPEALLDENQQQSLLYASDLEMGEAIGKIVALFEELRPARVVLDSLSEIRLLAQSSLRYRRQLLALKHYFSRQKATVLLLDDLTSESQDKTPHSIVHGVVRLEQLVPLYGADRRRLRVLKYRGLRFRGGYHDFIITTGGVQVFPRLVASEHHTRFSRDQLSSGVKEFDGLLGGGIEKGSSTLILGPAGTGKSLVAIQFAIAAIGRGERAALFIFDEEEGLLLQRMAGMGIDLQSLRASGKLVLVKVDAAEVSPGEFSHNVRHCVDEQNIRTVVIDSLNGYQAAMPEDQMLILHLHELLQYLNRQSATTFLTVAQHGLVGDMRAPVNITYLADTVILLRYFEALGEVRRALSVIKKRTGEHEPTIREFRIGSGGLKVDRPLQGFSGVLTGQPSFTDSQVKLMDGT